MMTVGVKAKGLKELDAFLGDLEPTIKRKAIKRGMVAMGRVYVLGIRERAPDAGNKSIARGTKNKSRGRKRQTVVIESPLWHLMEFGTDDRFTRAGHYTGKIDTGKFSFIIPTLEQDSDDAEKAFKDRFYVEIDKLKKKHA